MRILTVITARGGSKRLPGKNIKLLGEKPLIVWSIDVAKGIKDICDILVSTDDKEIAIISEKSGALVPWLRPTKLASDTASSAAVVLHALDWYERKKGNVDGLLLLQPTSPFRSRDTVLRGIALFKNNQNHSVIGVSPANSHPMWCFKIEGQMMKPYISGGGLHLQSQELSPAYSVNGAFFLISPRDLRTNNSFFKDGLVPLVMDHPAECIDIDTEWDWKIAKSVLNE